MANISCLCFCFLSSNLRKREDIFKRARHSLSNFFYWSLSISLSWRFVLKVSPWCVLCMVLSCNKMISLLSEKILLFGFNQFLIGLDETMILCLVLINPSFFKLNEFPFKRHFALETVSLHSCILLIWTIVSFLHFIDCAPLNLAFLHFICNLIISISGNPAFAPFLLHFFADCI